MSKAEETTLNYNFEDDVKGKKKKRNKKDSEKMSVFDILEPIVAALLVITIVFTLFFRIVNVSGRSMMPTLNNGDKIVISATAPPSRLNTSSIGVSLKNVYDLLPIFIRQMSKLPCIASIVSDKSVSGSFAT